MNDEVQQPMMKPAFPVHQKPTIAFNNRKQQIKKSIQRAVRNSSNDEHLITQGDYTDDVKYKSQQFSKQPEPF